MDTLWTIPDDPTKLLTNPDGTLVWDDHCCCNPECVGFSVSIEVEKLDDCLFRFTAVVVGGTGPFEYLWEFSDDSESTSNPVDKTIDCPESIGVLLTVTDANDCMAMAESGASFECPETLDADFLAYQDARTPCRICFDATATPTCGGTIVSWDWDFGDGSSGSGQNVCHTFAGSGPYDVVLTVTDSCGCTEEVEMEVLCCSNYSCNCLDLFFSNSPSDPQCTTKEPLELIVTIKDYSDDPLCGVPGNPSEGSVAAGTYHVPMNGCSGSLVVSGTTNGCAWDFEITVFLTGNRIQMAFYRIGFVGGSPGQVQYDTIDGICCAHYDADDVAFVANGGLSYFDVDAGITLVCG